MTQKSSKISSAPRKADKEKGERVAKVIARAGLCSRREAERWIAEGRVQVGGKVLDSAALNVTSAIEVLVDGEKLPAAEPLGLWRYHKPQGLLTTRNDPQGRRTVYDDLPENCQHLLTVGRLDINTEGLLLLTNDGGLKQRLELPATGWIRRYRARVFGSADPDNLARLINGITIDGIRYGAIKTKLERRTGANAWMTVALKEGKKREVRLVLEHFGLKVNRLIRTAYGPFQLGRLPRGAISAVPRHVLMDQLGDAHHRW